MDDWNLNSIKNNWAYKNKTETFIFLKSKLLKEKILENDLLLHTFILVYYYINMMLFYSKRCEKLVL